MENWQFILIAGLLLAALILLIVLLVRQSAFEREMGRGTDLNDLENEMIRLGEKMDQSARSSADNGALLRGEVGTNLRSMSESMNRTINESMFRMQVSNEQRLDRIEGVVSDKLDKSLNERLDAGMRNVAEQMGNLYRTLSNVKTRGVFGEVQLGRILEQTMPASQYVTNAVMKKNSDERVEFAVKFPPAFEGGEPVLLPVDAKFPSDIYNKIISAQDAGDAGALAEAVKELRNRILLEARKIRDKYIDPPATTNYAVMFLPTEGLYAEVLRVDGLTEKCQELGVIVAGPTTITALLNSLAVGFKNAQLSKKSVEIMHLLEAVKNQFSKFGEELDKTEKKLADAQASAARLRRRTETMERRMRTIGEIGDGEAERLLAADTEDYHES